MGAHLEALRQLGGDAYVQQQVRLVRLSRWRTTPLPLAGCVMCRCCSNRLAVSLLSNSADLQWYRVYFVLMGGALASSTTFVDTFAASWDTCIIRIGPFFCWRSCAQKRAGCCWPCYAAVSSVSLVSGLRQIMVCVQSIGQLASADSCLCERRHGSLSMLVLLNSCGGCHVCARKRMR